MGWAPEVVQRIRAGVTHAELDRLRGEVSAARVRLDQIGGDARVDTQLQAVEQHLSRCSVEKAWTSLKLAQRTMLTLLDDATLEVEALATREEAEEKLSGWRQATVAALLGSTSSTPSSSPPPPGQLMIRLTAARVMLDEHADNVYRKFRLLRRAVIRTSVALAVLLALIGAATALEWFPEPVLPEHSPLGDWRLLAVVTVLGALGALLSSAIELRGHDRTIRVPELRVSHTLMWMRPVIGAVGAIVVLVVLQAGFDGAIVVTSPGILPLAIAAGFTERLVTRTVNAAADAASK